MQVFIIGTPYETALYLDARRRHKQIIECEQIIKAIKTIRGPKSAWANHPAVLQYKNHLDWLEAYTLCLKSWDTMYEEQAPFWSELAGYHKPPFHTQEYFDQMKRRLYTKDPQHYAQWAHLGTSEINWYFVDGEWRHYKDGKLINKK